MSDEGAWKTVVAAALVLGVFWCVAGRPIPLARVRAQVVQPLIAVAILFAVAFISAGWLTARHAELRANAEARDAAELDAWGRGIPPAVDPYRQVFLEVRTDETRRNAVCQARRFFIASRFDAPLTLQPAHYSSVLFESRWDMDRVMKVLRHGGGRDTCDYVVVNRGDSDRRLLAALGQPIASSGMFLTYRVIRP